MNPNFSHIPPIFLLQNPINLPYSWQNNSHISHIFYQVASGRPVNKETVTEQMPLSSVVAAFHAFMKFHWTEKK